jgi:thymidylate synthase ThyX
VFNNDQIKATIIQDSINHYTKTRIITYELEYPRFIHSEVMTHKMLAKNAASSRAIPVAKTIEQVTNNPAHPVFWGKNQPGMQSVEELEDDIKEDVQSLWKSASQTACIYARYMEENGAHKQIVNRILEPFVMMKIVITGTEWNNFFWLRNHKDAQPEFRDLAAKMQKAKDESKPFILFDGEWHVPYINRERYTLSNGESNIIYSIGADDDADGIQDLTTDEALMLSSSLCAQTSYRKADDTLEKAVSIYKRLVESEPVHASPFEHQGMCKNIGTANLLASLLRFKKPTKGITHIDFDHNWWSGNLKHFVQYRQLIPNNVRAG